MIWLLVLILLVAAVVGFPTIGPWPNSGYYPSGILTIVLIVVLILILPGRL